MPFSLHFDSKENTELLDISDLEALALLDESNKFDSIVFDTYFNQLIPKLPTFIKHVEFGHYFNQDISGIGDHIESIKFQVAEFNYDLATFPKSLRELKIASDKITSKIENINPGLEKLTIQIATFNDELNLVDTNITSLKILSGTFNKCLHQLPSGLKILEINCDRFNSPVDNLPPGLESLKISSNIFNQPVNNLPLGLKKLLLEHVDLFMQPLNNLPHGLENLNLHLGYHYDDTGVNIYKHTLENLPNSIKKMVLANYWGDLNTIGDGVVELDVWFPPNKSREVRTHIQHWKKLPSSLKILDINKEISRINKVHNMVDVIKSNLNLKGICVNGVVL